MNVSNERRVVVTGVAAISPFGLTVEDLWSGLTEGRSAVGSSLGFFSRWFAIAACCRSKFFHWTYQ